eukprot:9234755-Karenia_brevis.AAC.1
MGVDDAWQQIEGGWLRLHTNQRDTMYVPSMDEDGPDIRGLAPIRITLPTDGWDRPTLVDNWHRDAARADTAVTGSAWKGKT